jgi:16S rRNA (uracil1498-N3)-methyltransferase
VALYDFSAPRLFVDAPLAPGGRLTLDGSQTNYLVNVLRLRVGGDVLVFNGRDGEWRARLAAATRKTAELELLERTREQTEPLDLLYLFAPLKHARLDYVVQKAVEMGVGALKPIFTRHTQVTRVNRERMRANVVEAAEQCGILSLPAVLPEEDFRRALDGLDRDRMLIFCDENAPLGDPIEALRGARNITAKFAVIVGPEGGFTDEERTGVLGHPAVVRLSLGPRVLRADTAAVAVLALVQAVLGDWR